MDFSFSCFERGARALIHSRLITCGQRLAPIRRFPPDFLSHFLLDGVSVLLTLAGAWAVVRLTFPACVLYQRRGFRPLSLLPLMRICASRSRAALSFLVAFATASGCRACANLCSYL